MFGRHKSAVELQVDELSRESGSFAESRCFACGASLDEGERFCTACGTSQLPSEPGSAVSAGTGHALPFVESRATPAVGPTAESPRRHRVRAMIPVGLTVIVLGAGVAISATLWRSEAKAHQRATSRLAASEARGADLSSRLQTTKVSLAQAQSLASKRKQVLLQANHVLKRVDPLLSSVDELQQVTSDIRNSRDGFAADSDQMVADLITLYNYVSQTSAEYIDWSWVSGQVDVINNELATVRNDSASLSSYDGSYDDASKRFGLRATAYTSSVRALQGQLKDAVAEK